MSQKISIKDLTTKEKIQLMESLWDELRDPSSGYTPPQWHDEVLLEREEAQEPYTDWEVAKEEIKNRVR
ncbi:addiction module protein [Rhodohalobacter sp.]|uniref:addiction module protein n=1 Tax=Rhodohalobacter sp. TaxID=1974210 RepID=UPI002ACE0BA6|nr:addiction module protein [Rhodohalobacter sp.]MDZ7757909.1 addiction module protein [Rhodohalobacter sp.]